MELLAFTLNIGAALLMGVAIGLERQYRQHAAGLRTNALVAVGAALFVSLAILLNDKTSPTRMASYVVSGVGFLGGGVILREGLNVKGISTAATLWCSAAIGVLSGSGFPLFALVGTAVILAINFGLRPLSQWIDAKRMHAIDVETHYRIRVVCAEREEALIRTVLLRHVNSQEKMITQSISMHPGDSSGEAVVVADIHSQERQDRIIQDVLNRLSIEPSVKSMSWQKVEQSAG